MRAATCTPVDFAGNSQFFGRDSGLLCRGFEAAGHDAFVIMPGETRADDEKGIVRGSTRDLSNSTWWRSQSLDLVVFYAWGDPRFRAVAEAIRSAGIPLVQSLDTAGLITPYGNLNEWWQSLTGMLLGSQPLNSRIRLIVRSLRDFAPHVFETKRLAMIDCSDSVAVVSEPAAHSVANYARSLGYPQVADKVIVAPHPISPLMVASARHKAGKILVVGRWLAEDRHQKDPELTMAVLGKFLHRHPSWLAEIVGRGTTGLKALSSSWEESSKSRLTLTDAIPRQELVARYQESRILLCCSRYESFHISSAEALCCGCSVVVADHPLLASTGWFTTRNSGTLAKDRTLDFLSIALDEEVEAWETGKRDAERIATTWGSELHAHHVASGILNRLKSFS